MFFPQFLVGMLTTSGIVGTWAYAATGSIWKAAAWGIIVAVLLQVGYFALVFRLVYRRRDTKQGVEETTSDVTKQPVVPRQPLHRDGRKKGLT
ncbi:hypothetical protein [Mesorhizobium sp. f-mel]